MVKKVVGDITHEVDPMKTRQLGDIIINRILESEAPFAQPLEFFDAATPEAVEPHRHWLEPWALDPASGKMILPVQSYLVQTRHHTILIDTCVGCRKTYDGVPVWKDLRDETWLHKLAHAGVELGNIDYVFCTHLHVDHCGWNTRLIDGRWTPTFPNAKYIFAAAEYAACETGGTAVFRENVFPVMEAGQAVLVDTDYALDDEVWLIPSPGHTVGHVSVNIASQGRTAVMIGDLMHSPIQLAHPEWSPNFDFDPALSAETRRRFLDSHCETDTVILTAHFPSPSVGLVVPDAERAFGFKYMSIA
jgi:glyoxylase-like metal-dependent hydrolase (beta-lactamase superfamily II)